MCYLLHLVQGFDLKNIIKITQKYHVCFTLIMEHPLFTYVNVNMPDILSDSHSSHLIICDTVTLVGKHLSILFSFADEFSGSVILLAAWSLRGERESGTCS